MKRFLSTKTRNVIAFSTDYIFFALAFGFANINTIIPVFAAELGLSKSLIGVMLSLISIAWTLPQVAAGNVTSGQRKKKPLLIRMALLGRPVTLLIPLVLWLSGGTPAWLNLFAVLLAFNLFFFSDAFAAIPWFDILGRVFPSEKRGGYIAWWQAGKAVGMVGVSAIVSYVLSSQSFPDNYIMLFTATSLCLGASIGGLSLIVEPEPTEEESGQQRIPWRQFIKVMGQILKTDRVFLRAALSRILFSLSCMAAPFYVLYATEELAFSPQIIGGFLLAQTVGASLGSLVLGRISNRQGTQRVLKIGLSILLTVPVLALIMALTAGSIPDSFRYLYFWIYIGVGLSDNIFMLGFLNYILDMAPPAQGPVYMGLYNGLGTIGMLGTAFAGWLITRTSYSLLFALALGFGVISWIIAFRLPLARRAARSEHITT